MRKKIITMAATLLLLGLLSAVEQMAVKRLTDGAHAGNPVAACAKPDGARA